MVRTDDSYTLNICEQPLFRVVARALQLLILVKCVERKLTAGDVGGQKTLRPYWRNYFESTDAVVWVVDSSDEIRIEDCKEELRGLLGEEVSLAEPGTRER